MTIDVRQTRNGMT